MLNFVICDDDLNMVNRISSLLEKVIISNDFDGKIVFKTTSSNELLSYISNNKINVVFLDIEFSGCHKNGLDIAKQIRTINKDCYLIFVTSHFEYIAEAYKFTTFDYIFKSCIDFDTINSTLTRLFSDAYSTEKKFVKLEHKNIFLDLNDIFFIEKDGPKIIYHTSASNYVIYNSFNKINLPNNFVRCHKSFIANINNISFISLNDNIVHFKDGSSCFIGPKYKKKLLEVMNCVTIR